MKGYSSEWKNKKKSSIELNIESTVVTIKVEPLLLLLLTISQVIGGNGDHRMQHSNSSTGLFDLRPIFVERITPHQCAIVRSRRGTSASEGCVLCTSFILLRVTILLIVTSSSDYWQYWTLFFRNKADRLLVSFRLFSCLEEMYALCRCRHLSTSEIARCTT